MNLVLSLCLIYLISTCVSIYHVDSYRYIALVIGFSDKYVSVCYILATVSRFFCG